MIVDILLILILLICLVTDLKSRKIYNKVIFPSIIAAFLLHFISNGIIGVWFSILGLLVGFSILLIPYFMGGMGAGDVKLLALIGALKGMTFVIMTSIYMALLGGLLGVIVLLFRKGAFKRMKSILYTLSCFRFGVRIPLSIDKEGLKTTYPYGIAIAGGAFISLFYKGLVIL
jgi:prepilin peptidase CpaA